jgi:quercetin dioxygenase-like cupin family protein
MSTLIEPFAMTAGEGTLLETPTGDAVRIKTNTRNTHGSLTVLEFVISPKNGPALHTHVREDEVWYVLEGEFRFKAGETMFQVATGGRTHPAGYW